MLWCESIVHLYFFGAGFQNTVFYEKTIVFVYFFLSVSGSIYLENG